MAFTQADLEKAGYHVPAAPINDWRTYDEGHPVPNYFDFDWFSARHPDLYHAFALSTVGVMRALERMVDLSGLEVIDVGAGTGRSTIEAAKTAKKVTAVDVFEGAARFGRDRIREAGLHSVTYTRAHGACLPFPANSFDACLSCWAEPHYAEAYRVLRPGGYHIVIGGAPGALCGELTALLAEQFPALILEVAPEDQYDPQCPDKDAAIPDETLNGLPVLPPTIRRDFTYVADYGDYCEAAAILGRLYGPEARRYFIDRKQSTVAWRLRIEVIRVRK